MKLLQFKVNGRVYLGIKTVNGILDVEKARQKYNLTAPENMEAVIKQGQAGVHCLQQLINRAETVSEKSELFLKEEEIQFAPCITYPEKIICVGLNYVNHAEESRMPIPSTPVLFSKFNNALAANNQVIELPKNAEKFDYEAELVIVIGKDARNVSYDQALSYVFGYTIGNDFSARDLQMRTGQWLLGKTCDCFAPVGPYIVTADEISDPQYLTITCEVNGELRQSATTKDMIFDCATIVSYISNYMTLKAGDIIFSGTPHGVILGYPEEQQKWLKAGDKVTVSIDKVGTLVNSLM